MLGVDMPQGRGRNLSRCLLNGVNEKTGLPVEVAQCWDSVELLKEVALEEASERKQEEFDPLQRDCDRAHTKVENHEV